SAAPAAAGQARKLQIQIGPLERPEQANAIKELFRDIPGLGAIQDLESPQPDTRLFAVETTSTNDDLLDLFAFHVAKEHVLIRDAAAPASSAPPAADDEETLVVAGAAGGEEPYGFFNNAPGAPAEGAQAAAAPVPVKAAVPKAAEPRAASQTQMESTTIRVDVKKVDQLINLVGELVITQAMLAQNSRGLDSGAYQQLLAGLADLDRNTRDLQESVMSI